MKFLLASNNEHKLSEINRILSELDIDVVTPSQIGISIEVDENGSTFEENALIKAKYAAEALGMPAIADDSGLVVFALNGQPGIFSARFAGENATDLDRINKLLSMMDGVVDRQAQFVCAIAFCDMDGFTFTVRGVCDGQITESPVGENGFGYDPVFCFPGLNKTFAQLVPDEKNRISHRGSALEQFYDKIKKYLLTKGENIE